MNASAITLSAVGRNTHHLQRAIDFYCGVLGFGLMASHAPLPPWAMGSSTAIGATGCARLQLGAQTLELVAFPRTGHDMAEPRANDAWFQHCALVATDMARVWDRLKKHAVCTISRDGPQRLPLKDGDLLAFKFRDPDGHAVEVLQFPPHQAPAPWPEVLRASQASSPEREDTALGIDHSALCCSSLSRSIDFYQRLGLRVTGHSLNQGQQQDRLDDLQGTVLEVATLAAAASAIPRLELLAYQHPPGRTAPAHDLTSLYADRLCFCIDPAGARRARLTGPLTLRDPDHHWVVLSPAPERDNTLSG